MERRDEGGYSSYVRPLAFGRDDGWIMGAV
jgi:hypothetical protein